MPAARGDPRNLDPLHAGHRPRLDLIRGVAVPQLHGRGGGRLRSGKKGFRRKQQVVMGCCIAQQDPVDGLRC